DLRNGRTGRSLALLLSRFPGNELLMISPRELSMGSDVVEQLTGARVDVTDDFQNALTGLDVLYQTRIQAERFASPDDYERFRGIDVLTVDLMSRMPAHAIV